MFFIAILREMGFRSFEACAIWRCEPWLWTFIPWSCKWSSMPLKSDEPTFESSWTFMTAFWHLCGVWLPYKPRVPFDAPSSKKVKSHDNSKSYQPICPNLQHFCFGMLSKSHPVISISGIFLKPFPQSRVLRVFSGISWHQIPIVKSFAALWEDSYTGIPR